MRSRVAHHLQDQKEPRASLELGCCYSKSLRAMIVFAVACWGILVAIAAAAGCVAGGIEDNET